MEKEHRNDGASGSGSSAGLMNSSPKVTFYFGLMSGIAVVSIVGFFLTFSMLRNEVSGTGTNKTAGTTNTAAAPTNTAGTVPTTAPTKVDIAVKDTDYIRGNADAKVTLIEYSDFECPFCATVRPTIDQVLEQYGDDVRLIYRHYPLSFHPQAQKAAEASECAAEQDKFWEMHDKLFDMNTAGTLSLANFKKAAGELSLNQNQFDTCLDSGKYQQKVTDDLNEGTQYGVQGTPATFVNGTLVSGAVPLAQFTAAVDAALNS